MKTDSFGYFRCFLHFSEDYIGSMIVADIRVVPVGAGTTSMSQHVKAVHDMLDEEGIKYMPNPMSTLWRWIR